MIPGGYAGKVLRVDLSSRRISTEFYPESILQKYLGGIALAVKILYDEVPLHIEYNDPENRLILFTGPLTGTKVMGSGGFTLSTKGALTNGATSTQANGFLGAYMKRSGFDGIIIHGKADRPVYLYLHEGIAALKDASNLIGKGIRETEKIIKRELKAKSSDLSVFGIGPAGENLVRFAGILGDYGHSASHNGVGAVMGSKQLKAIVAKKGKKRVSVVDPTRLSTAVDEAFQRTLTHPRLRRDYEWGTSKILVSFSKTGLLPVKNYTTNRFPNCEKFDGSYYRKHYETKRHRCWACRMHHTHFLKVTEGPYTGYEGKEPEYEQWAAWGPQIGQTDPGAAVMLSNETNDLGMDCNEASWIIGMVMELYEKGFITLKHTNGIDMAWGNAEAVRAMLHKIANREGIGNILAEGVKRAAEILGPEAIECGIYTKKANTMRGHDDRAAWKWMFDQCVSSTGTSQSGGTPRPLPSFIRSLLETQDADDRNQNPFSVEAVTDSMIRDKGIVQVEDSLVTCQRCLPDRMEIVVEMLNAVTGWNLSEKETLDVGLRALHLMKVFNLKNGIDASFDVPSKRYSSVPTDGPAVGKSIIPFWTKMLSTYYENMGWDKETGKPLPETLHGLDLGHLVSDIWEDNETDSPHV
ncbi:aldehyde ferredoxin oxidoreductase family protein [Thermodesulfobacteriota bacterium]